MDGRHRRAPDRRGTVLPHCDAVRDRKVELMTGVTESESTALHRDQPDLETPVLVVDRVSKKYSRDLLSSLIYGLRDIGRELTLQKPSTDTLRRSEFWALRNVSCSVPRGSAIGLMGQNGCGKSTLMRIMSGIIKPTDGTVSVHGRIAPLLSLGAGFNPILTGRENISINMTILGASEEQIAERFEDVVAFSEIEYALDAPVQNYSSGMKARLGFACAVHTDPDILFVDEVLVVGDIQFRQKCQDKLRELREMGSSFILVHHAPQLVRNLCDQGVYLAQGQVVATGGVDDVVGRYEEDLKARSSKRVQPVTSPVPAPAPRNGGLKFRSIALEQKETPVEILETGVETTLVIVMSAPEDFKNVNLRVRLREHLVTAAGAASGPSFVHTRVLYFTGRTDGATFNLKRGESEVRIGLPDLGLIPGEYTLNIEAEVSGSTPVVVAPTLEFSVRSTLNTKLCRYYQRRKWILPNGHNVDFSVSPTPQ